MITPAVRIQPLRGRAMFAVLALGLCVVHGLTDAVLPPIRPGYVLDRQITLVVLAAAGLVLRITAEQDTVRTRPLGGTGR